MGHQQFAHGETIVKYEPAFPPLFCIRRPAGRWAGAQFCV